MRVESSAVTKWLSCKLNKKNQSPNAKELYDLTNKRGVIINVDIVKIIYAIYIGLRTQVEMRVDKDGLK